VKSSVISFDAIHHMEFPGRAFSFKAISPSAGRLILAPMVFSSGTAFQVLISQLKSGSMTTTD
jgi:hypothetical protein